MMNNNVKIQDPVNIEGIYAVFSTYVDDMIFSREKVNNPIFSGGIVKEVHSNVYNILINDLVGFISYIQNPNLMLSSNTIIPIPEKEDFKLFAILPYASFAMKILRLVNPTLAHTILLLGDGWFFNLLKKIFELSGAEIILLNISENLDTLNGKHIDSIIYSKSNPQISEIISKLQPKHQIELMAISYFDIGLDDPVYRKGIKYPYSYIRWDFKRNLEYFVNLVKQDNTLLDFFEVDIINVKGMDNIEQNIRNLKESSVYLFRKASDEH